MIGQTYTAKPARKRVLARSLDTVADGLEFSSKDTMGAVDPTQAHSAMTVQREHNHKRSRSSLPAIITVVDGWRCNSRDMMVIVVQAEDLSAMSAREELMNSSN